MLLAFICVHRRFQTSPYSLANLGVLGGSILYFSSPFFVPSPPGGKEIQPGPTLPPPEDVNDILGRTVNFDRFVNLVAEIVGFEEFELAYRVE